MNKQELKTEVAAVVALKDKELEAKVSELISAQVDAEAKLATAEEKAKADSEKAKAEIEALNAHIEKFQENPDEIKRFPKTFKIGKKEYHFKPGVKEVVVPARIVQDKTKAGTLTVEAVVNDKEIREALVEIGFGGIEEVPSE